MKVQLTIHALSSVADVGGVEVHLPNGLKMQEIAVLGGLDFKMPKRLAPAGARPPLYQFPGSAPAHLRLIEALALRAYLSKT